MFPRDSSAIVVITDFSAEMPLAIVTITLLYLIEKETIGINPTRNVAAKIGYNEKMIIIVAMIDTMHLTNIETFADKLFSTTSTSLFNLEMRSPVLCSSKNSISLLSIEPKKSWRNEAAIL